MHCPHPELTATTAPLPHRSLSPSVRPAPLAVWFTAGLVGLALAGCAAVPAPPPAPSKPANPSTPSAPAATSTTGAASTVAAEADDHAAGFAAWRTAFAAQALAAGIAPHTVRDVLGQAQWQPRVVELDRAQPEFSRTPWAYLDSAISVQRVAQGQAKRAEHGPTLEAASRCELFTWRATPEGRLAEILVLDQFSRNVYRDTARAFAQDALALALAQELVASGQDRSLPTAQRVFAYMPYMHSESAVIHEQALTLFAQPGLENNLDFERRHKAIIDRFGRYPHRNAVLVRTSTAEELAFLSEPGSSF